MLEYFFTQNGIPSVMQHSEEIDFLYHINHCDWPVVHGHKDYWEFTIITKGSLKNCNAKNEVVYGAKTMFVSTPHDIHSIHAVDNNPVRYINIMVKEERLLRILNNISPSLLEQLRSDGFSLALPENIISEIEQILLRVNYYNPEQYYKENTGVIHSAFLLILSVVLLEFSTNLPQMPQQFIELNKLLQNSDLVTCNVNTLCRKIGVTRKQLNTLVNKCYGVSPHEYLTKYKFNYACTLLANTNMTISAIASEIGYSNTATFHTTFKRLYDMTPAQYRKGIHTKHQ